MSDVDKHPAFYSSYVPPKTAVLALVQQPEYQITGRSLADAVMQDFRATKRNPHASSRERKEG